MVPKAMLCGSDVPCHSGTRALRCLSWLAKVESGQAQEGCRKVETAALSAPDKALGVGRVSSEGFLCPTTCLCGLGPSIGCWGVLFAHKPPKLWWGSCCDLIGDENAEDGD